MTPNLPENRILDHAEMLPRGELQALQLKRLQKAVAHAQNIPYYQDAFAKAGILADSIQSLDDLRRLPFTTKDDLREQYPLGMLAVDRSEVLRFHGSSGTTGKPTMVAYTRNDLNMWANLCARFLTAGGLRPEHTVQIAFGYGLFTGGFGLHYGVERVGASVIPAAAGNTPKQVMLLMDMQADALVCTPSYALTISEFIISNDIPRDALNLKYAFFGGEPWTQDMADRIESELGIASFNNYGLSEVIGPGISGECIAKNGMHISEDYFIVECINPQTLEPVAPGEQGELVFTTLCREAMPIIRYRTRDIASLNPEPCSCGRTTMRMSRVTGRSDDMLIIKGVNVYPSQIEQALLRVEGTAPHYQIIVDRPDRTDIATVQVEMTEELFSAGMKEMQELKEKISRAVQGITGLRMNIELVSPNTLERFTGKASRVKDLRREKGLI
ncbi:phenylacetate--CoA ligase family protein [Tichowtungia aerotolerans]|uniref:Phenylacetate-coenzyme A ligase n=1 Tax=Tichowtungia aerotolerans TaxID=2697043 RepID=A0A6P1M7L2_9BACT|nr:phenylacetate--CoA ligase [Tichowtungia aerotolerans]QHI70580.1 AMP-binding protein [Tichowtungia aerotolerans]